MDRRLISLFLLSVRRTNRYVRSTKDFVLVTGGAGGIGAAVVTGFARLKTTNPAGSKVSLPKPYASPNSTARWSLEVAP
jgi:hypothetical protein